MSESFCTAEVDVDKAPSGENGRPFGAAPRGDSAVPNDEWLDGRVWPRSGEVGDLARPNGNLSSSKSSGAG